MTLVLGPVPCINCRRVVSWTHAGGRWRLMERRGTRSRHHVCAAVCGAYMPNARANCARSPGHTAGEHRTRDAMDDAARARRKWAA